MLRREFLKASAGAGAAAWNARPAARVRGANDRLRVGLIGCGGRGSLDARNMRGARNVDIAALCDANTAKTVAARRWAPRATVYGDFRELLADRSIDAAIVATPDPWHAQMTILACEAGKDVYLETPAMYRLAEASAMREAVRRTGRIVQVGSQFRSAGHIAEAAGIVQSGRLGAVKFVRAWNHRIESAGRPAPDSEPPAGLNWDAWLGPSPLVPFNGGRLNYRAFLDYSNGPISDAGTHAFSAVHQIMGMDKPLKVSSSTAMIGRRKVGDIADLQQATYEYPGFVMSYEGRIYHSCELGGDADDGIAFHGTEAALFVDRTGVKLHPAPRGGSSLAERMLVNEGEASLLHARHFVDCVRNRKEPIANLETEVRAMAVACMGNVAAWTGRRLAWDDASWQFPGDAEANRFLFREYRKPWDLVKFA